MYKPTLKRSDSDIPDVVYERRILKYLPPEIKDLDWEAMVDIFIEIDVERRGYITRDQLDEYFKTHGVPHENVEKWFTWFEGEHKGIITMEDVCTTLGIPMRQEYAEKVGRKRSMISQGIIPAPAEAPALFAAKPQSPPMNSSSKSPMDGVEVLTKGGVSNDILEDCVRYVKNYPGNFKEEQEMARYLKDLMERNYKKHWQVVVASSTIGCMVAHEVNMFIHFRYNNHIYILYRIPDLSTLN